MARSTLSWDWTPTVGACRSPHAQSDLDGRGFAAVWRDAVRISRDYRCVVHVYVTEPTEDDPVVGHRRLIARTSDGALTGPF